ncbi:VAMP-associated protein [Multifurca ochricompacta]|uniref:VAMP-associated protein n=1 Tax=Multifurca ochricompacta TaxID=376703 RepID=A0AAD4M6Q1_9AGAM|nr:VAMP-associated protein [Multifurca ochricompacta]
MSVTLQPSNSLGFNRPLTQNVKRSLSITNPNADPISFKIKTTAPKLYCVRPNSGKVEPGQTVEVQVMLQAMKEEPPLNSKCKDKFLIQSMLIPPERASLPLHDLWNIPEGEEPGKIHSQKVKVNYLPPEGHPLDEEDELPHRISMMSGIAPDDAHLFGTVKGRPSTYGPPGDQMSVMQQESSRHAIVERPATPLDYSPQQDEPSREEPAGGVGVINVNVHSPQPPPAPAPLVAPAPPSEPNPEFLAKYKDAQAEIQRLRSLLAAVPDPSSVASSGTSPTELRERHRGRSPRSDDGTVVDSEVTYVSDASLQPEGVPLQIVVIIASLVFITTYLFF